MISAVLSCIKLSLVTSLLIGSTQCLRQKGEGNGVLLRKVAQMIENKGRRYGENPKLSFNDITKMLREGDEGESNVENVDLHDDQATLIEKELIGALAHKKSALLDKPYIESQGRNDFLVLHPAYRDPFVTVIPNMIYYNIEKRCVNWLDDCNLHGMKARLLKQVQSPYKNCWGNFLTLRDFTTGNLASPQNVTKAVMVAAAGCPLFNDNHTSGGTEDQVYCNSTYDGYLCWPRTLGGHRSEQRCPNVRFSDATRYAYRQCGLDGKWEGRHSNDTNPNGWTNYTPCFPPVIQSLFYKVYDEDESHAQNKFEIADITRTIEIIGFTLSFISLTISLIILNNYKSLNNIRTRIHKNLFSAMNAQVILRLIIYIDQAIMRRDEGKANYTGISAIEKMTYLCVSTYVLLEYFITVMFMWMLCEGFYLNTIVTNNVLRAGNSYKFYFVIGWLMSMVITASWSAFAGVHYAHTDSTLVCWYGYNFQPNFWIIQGPRLAVILVNLCFLLNILRVLVLKLREDTTSDVVKTRKALKAAMVLLPLFGITNILSMFEGPVAGPPWQFAAWSYTSHSLRSFQGVVLAWLYCLGTAEIQAVLSRSYATRLAIFRHRHPRLARCLGLQRKRKIQRFPRNHPGLSTGRLNAHLENIALGELIHVQPNQQQTTVTDEQEMTVTDLNETTNVTTEATAEATAIESTNTTITVEVHRPHVTFIDEPTTIEIPCGRRKRRRRRFKLPRVS